MPTCVICGQELYAYQSLQAEVHWYHRRYDEPVEYTLWCDPQLTGRIEVDVANPEFHQQRII